MRLYHFVVSALLAGLAATSAHAEDIGRYRLEKTADGYVRMDTETGTMSKCSEQSGQLVCRMAADERNAFQDEADRLRSSIKALEERVGKLENSLSARLESKLPSEEEFNRTMGYMERFFRGFLGIVKDLEKDEAGPAPAPSPNRT